MVIYSKNRLQELTTTRPLVTIADVNNRQQYFKEKHDEIIYSPVKKKELVLEFKRRTAITVLAITAITTVTITVTVLAITEISSNNSLNGIGFI